MEEFISGVPAARVSLHVRDPASELAGYCQRSLRTLWSIFQKPSTRVPVHARLRDFGTPPFDQYEVR